MSDYRKLRCLWQWLWYIKDVLIFITDEEAFWWRSKPSNYSTEFIYCTMVLFFSSSPSPHHLTSYLAAIKVIAKHGWWNTTLPLPGPQSISQCAEASSTNPRWWLPESTNQNAASPLLSTNESADNRVALLAIRWACHRHLCPSCQNLAQFFPWSSKNRQHWPPWVLKSSHISGNYQCGQIKVGKNLARWALNASMEITVKRGGGWVSQVGSSINPQSATVPPFPHRYHRLGRRGGLNGFLNERKSVI